MTLVAERPRPLFPNGIKSPAAAAEHPPVTPVDSPGSPGEAATDASMRRVLPAALLREDEVVIMALRPSMLYVFLHPLSTYIVILVATLLCSIVSSAVDVVSTPWAWTVPQVWLLGVTLLVIRFCWACLEWYSHLFLLTDRRVLTRSGVIRVRVYEASLRHIRQTLVHVSIRERLFRLGTVLFATAGTAVYDTAWPMIRKPVTTQRAVQEALARWGDASG